MKQQIILWVSTLLLLTAGAGCEKESNIIKNFPSKPCAELPKEHTIFVQKISHVKDIVEKDPNISFGGNHFYVKVKSMDLSDKSRTFVYPEVLKIYPACIILTEQNIGHHINLSGSLYYTIGHSGVLNMIAYVYVLKT